MTVLQALDERELLVKKITGRIQKLEPVAMVRPGEDVICGRRIRKEDFSAQAGALLQQLQDLIRRYDELSAAITVSNATHFVETRRGQMSVAGALALRSRLRADGAHGQERDFEGRLAERLLSCLEREKELLRHRNGASGQAASSARKNGRILILQNKESSASDRRDVCPSGSAPGLRLFDPLGARKRADEILEARDALLRELELAIKISNATTYIEV